MQDQIDVGQLSWNQSGVVSVSVHSRCTLRWRVSCPVMSLVIEVTNRSPTSAFLIHDGMLPTDVVDDVTWPGCHVGYG